MSICIPVYKQTELLKRLLESILIQDYTDYEIIVTDDSPDSSVEEVCKEFLSRNVNLTYIKNVERKGTPENWNEAIRHANGEYIKIMHHDDWFLNKDSLSQFVKMLDKNKRANFAFSGSLWYSPDGKLQFQRKANGFRISKLRKDPEFLFANNFVGTPSVTIFRKKIGIFFDSDFKWVVDFGFYIQAIKTSGIFEYTKDSLVAIRVKSDDQVTAECLNDKNVQISEYFNLYEKIHPKKERIKPYVFQYFWYLFDLFGIKSADDIRNCGVKGEVPEELTASFWSRSIRLSAPVVIKKRIAYLFIRVYGILISNIVYRIIVMKNFISKKKNQV